MLGQITTERKELGVMARNTNFFHAPGDTLRGDVEIYYEDGEAADEVVRVKKSYLAVLEKDQRFLRALEAAGVGNWDGYDVAKDILDEWENE